MHNKNTSQYVASVITLLHFLLVFISLLIGGFPVFNVVLFSILAAVILWIFSFSIVEALVNRNIKNLYKLILRTKTDKREELTMKNILPPKTLKEVEEDIKTWSQNHINELDFYKKLSAYKKTFLQNLSHEIRTPLFSVQAYCENIKMNIAQRINKKDLENDLDVILRNIYRLNNLIHDINEINKLEGQQIVLNQTEFNLEQLIKEVLEELKFLTTKNDTRITIKFINKKITIYADREKIKQVLTNLIENAIKYNPKKTIITFNVTYIDDKNISFEVSDNGNGIAPEHIERIFERFYRVDANRSRKLGGTGLGLSICKYIMEMHNSYISIRSKINIGTTFSLGLKTEK